MLRYLFEAHFADGGFIQQTQDDTARYAPQGSAFSDVLWMERECGVRLVAFALCIDDVAGLVPLAAVHLTDGHFELGGNEFYAGTDGLGEGVERRLIYYRQVTQVREQDVYAATGEAVTDWRETTRTRYVIGWQATIDGRNVQHVIALDG